MFLALFLNVLAEIRSSIWKEMYLILKANDLFPLYNMMEVNWVQQIFKKKVKWASSSFKLRAAWRD